MLLKYLITPKFESVFPFVPAQKIYISNKLNAKQSHTFNEPHPMNVSIVRKFSPIHLMYIFRNRYCVSLVWVGLVLISSL